MGVAVTLTPSTREFNFEMRASYTCPVSLMLMLKGVPVRSHATHAAGTNICALSALAFTRSSSGCPAATLSAGFTRTRATLPANGASTRQ